MAVVLTLCSFLIGIGAFVIRSIQQRLNAEEEGLRETRDALAKGNISLAQLARYDSLTGLPNRRYFEIRSAVNEWERSSHCVPTNRGCRGRSPVHWMGFCRTSGALSYMKTRPSTR